MPDHPSESTQLPFGLIQNVERGSPLSKASITIHPDQSYSINSGAFSFQNGTLAKNFLPVSSENFSTIKSNSSMIPYFSIGAIILVILVRNLFYTAFQKYLISPVNNYEIDFSFQKIGIAPILFALLIALLAFSDFLNSASPIWLQPNSGFFDKLKISGQILFYPLFGSVFLLLFLNFSARFFPIIFSDIKTLFVLALVVLIWNFLSFGLPGFKAFPSGYFFAIISGLYFLIRSFLFFNVFRKAYRFHMPITLFYICILNLGTFLFLYQGLRSIF